MEQSKDWKYFLIADLAGKIIGAFKDVFLGIYFLKITRRKYSRSFTLLYCIFYDVFDWFISSKQNAKNEFINHVSNWNIFELNAVYYFICNGRANFKLYHFICFLFRDWK